MVGRRGHEGGVVFVCPHPPCYLGSPAAEKLGELVGGAAAIGPGLDAKARWQRWRGSTALGIHNRADYFQRTAFTIGQELGRITDKAPGALCVSSPPH